MASKREFWFQHVEAWRKGRMAQSEYARKHNLSIKSFGYYRRRYFQEKEQTTGQLGSPIILYDYQPGRGHEYPLEFLNGFTGHLQCDGMKAYEALRNKQCSFAHFDPPLHQKHADYSDCRYLYIKHLYPFQPSHS